MNLKLRHKKNTKKIILTIVYRLLMVPMKLSPVKEAFKSIDEIATHL